MNIFKETNAGNSRAIKKKYSQKSDHLAVAKIFSEWSGKYNNHYSTESNNQNDSYLLSKNSLILMYSEYFSNHLFIYCYFLLVIKIKIIVSFYCCY